MSEENNVKRLKNGWVWNNQYYATKNDLNKDYYQRIHIGKSSAGWNFLLAIYPEFNINNITDWKRLFSAPENIIIDEDGTTISPQEMIEIITKRKASGFDSTIPLEIWEQEEVRAANRLQSFFLEFSVSNNISQFYKTYDEYLAANSAIRGPNGLFARDPAKDPNIQSGGKNKTYDYISNTIFS